MESVEKLYGWDDGKIYFSPDEDTTLCVTDQHQLLDELISVCERYYENNPPHTGEASTESFEPEVPEVVNSTDGTRYDLDDIAEEIFSRSQFDESFGLLNPETGEVIHYTDPAIVGDIEYEALTAEEQKQLKQDEVIPDGWHVLDNISAHESWHFRQRFARTINNPITQNRVLDAIQGKGAFRRFREIVLSDERMAARWNAFRTDCRRRYVLRLLLHEFDVEFPDEIRDILNDGR